MNIESLFSGIGMIIDDQIFNQNSDDKIISIVKDIEAKGFPLVKYEKIPTLNEKNISKFSFVLLDWELASLSDEGGNPIPIADELKKDTMNNLLKFIWNILDNSYLPIFIFSNSTEEDIKKELQNQQIDIDNSPIFIKNKAEIIEDGQVKVMDIIHNWIDSIPSLYVLKEWENAVNTAKIKAFKSLATTKYWPLVIWQAADEDSVSPNKELLDVLTQNIFGLMNPLSIEREQLFKQGSKQSTKQEILDVLRNQRLESNPDKEISITGDIYYLESTFYLNIRPTCDCISRNKPRCEDCKTKDKCIECPNANKVFLIRIDESTNTYNINNFNDKYGFFTEPSNEAFLGPLMDNKFYRFFFKEIIIRKYDDVKDKKAGRILEPFIRHITEKYALYVQRQALPRIPSQAIFDTLPVSEVIKEETVDNK